jgi:hypothetical protein
VCYLIRLRMTSGALILKDDCLSQIMSGFGDDQAASAQRGKDDQAARA